MKHLILISLIALTAIVLLRAGIRDNDARLLDTFETGSRILETFRSSLTKTALEEEPKEKKSNSDETSEIDRSMNSEGNPDDIPQNQPENQIQNREDRENEDKRNRNNQPLTDNPYQRILNIASEIDERDTPGSERPASRTTSPETTSEVLSEAQRIYRNIIGTDGSGN